MDDLSDILGHFKLETPIEVERFQLGVYTKGVYAPAVPSILLIEPAVIHPNGPEVLAKLPEGLRSSKSISVYTKEELRTAKAGEYEADIVRYQGLRYAVQFVENWFDNGMFYKIIAVKVEQ